MPAHQVPSKSNAVRPSYSRFIKWKGECDQLATEKGGWRMRVTVSHLKIDTNTHFFAFFLLPQGSREVRLCAPTRACPPPHVLPPRLSCTTQPSWAPRHSLCWRWHFSQPVNTLWSPLLLLCWQLRFFEFLCDVPGSALYVCCECDHNWVMCVGMKNQTLENECIEKIGV